MANHLNSGVYLNKMEKNTQIRLLVVYPGELKMNGQFMFAKINGKSARSVENEPSFAVNHVNKSKLKVNRP